jgi:hypothetical protein
MPELKRDYVCPPIYTRAEPDPDDEYPRPEPLEPNLIDRYLDPEDEEVDEDEDEMDERNYSS